MGSVSLPSVPGRGVQVFGARRRQHRRAAGLAPSCAGALPGVHHLRMEVDDRQEVSEASHDRLGVTRSIKHGPLGRERDLLHMF